MEPLAARIRPKTLADFVGQTELVGEGKPLRVAIEKKHIFSFIFWGPPGVGKTTLARIYADALDAEYYELSAVAAGKADIKAVADADSNGKPKVLFLDEIHRFNKAQQDYLLPFVESGQITLIGATTENPSFSVIAPLLSRSLLVALEPLSDADLIDVIEAALAEERGLGGRFTLDDAARDEAAVRRGLDGLTAAVREGRNAIPAMLDAVRAEATLGEICGLLRTLWGEYREPAQF